MWAQNFNLIFEIQKWPQIPSGYTCLRTYCHVCAVNKNKLVCVSGCKIIKPVLVSYILLLKFLLTHSNHITHCLFLVERNHNSKSRRNFTFSKCAVPNFCHRKKDTEFWARKKSNACSTEYQGNDTQPQHMCVMYKAYHFWWGTRDTKFFAARICILGTATNIRFFY